MCIEHLLFRLCKTSHLGFLTEIRPIVCDWVFTFCLQLLLHMSGSGLSFLSERASEPGTQCLTKQASLCPPEGSGPSTKAGQRACAVTETVEGSLRALLSSAPRLHIWIQEKYCQVQGLHQVGGRRNSVPKHRGNLDTNWHPPRCETVLVPHKQPCCCGLAITQVRAFRDSVLWWLWSLPLNGQELGVTVGSSYV